MPAPPARPLRRACLLLFVAAAGLYATSPVVTNWDSYLAVPSAYSLLHHGDLDLDEFHEASIREHYGFYAHDGRHFDFYGWPQAVLALPVVAVVDLAGSVGIGPGVGALIADDRMAAIQLVSASLLTAAVVVLVSMAAFGQLPGPEPRRRRLAIGIGAVFAVATPAWSTASRALWQHGPSMAALAVVVIAAGRLSAAGAGTRARRRAALLLGASVAAAFAVRPTNVVAGVVVSLWVLFGARRELGRFAGGALLVGVPFVAVNLAVYGSTLPPSHQTGGRLGHAHYLEALAVNLVSPSRGLLLFAPVVLAAAAGVVVRARSRQLRSLDLALAGVCVGHWLLVSATVGWWGGHAYGPRYMTDILPVLAFLSVPAVVAVATRPPTAASGRRAPRLRRLRPGAAALSVAVAWGVFVHAQGAYLRSSACWNSDPADVNVDFDRVWDWGDPQLVRGARALVDGSVRDAVLGDCAGGLGGTGTGTQTNGKP